MNAADAPYRIAPPAISPGACVGIVAPAGAVRRDEVEAGIARLEAAGFRVRVGAALWRRLGYLAGSDAERVRDLTEMFLDPAVDAVFAARGGYGCTRLLPLLDPQLLRSHAKIFVGSSDCTALLQFLVDHCGIVAFHGPVVATLAGREEALTGLLKVLAGSHDTTVRLPRILRGGHAEGVLRGGCLSILTSLLGTPFAPKEQRTVWFFEDVNEPPYRIDRMLTQWSQAGCWRGTTGVLWGEMMGCTGPEGSWDVWEVIAQHTEPLGVPVAVGLPSGHGANTLTLPLGVHVRLAEESLQFLEPCVVPNGIA